MEILYHCCKSLQANVNVVDRRLGLADILTRAIAALDKCKATLAATASVLSNASTSNDDELVLTSSHFPRDLLVVTAVVAARSNRPVIIVEGLNLIFHLIIEGVFTKDIMLDHVPFFSSLSAMIVGKPAVWVCVEALCHVMQSETVESPLQMKAVSCVAAIAADARLHLAGTILISTLQSCFNLALTSSAPTVQARSRQVLKAAIKERVIKPVLEVAELALSGTINSASMSTDLNNNNNNNNQTAQNQQSPNKKGGVGAAASTTTMNAEIFNSTPSFMMLNFVKVYRPDQESFDPSEYLQNFKVTRMARFIEFVDEEKQVSCVLKDVVQILESFFRLGSHPISPSVKTPDDVEIRTRQLALECIITILSEFPDHAADQENSIVAPILLLCEDSLWSCIGANIATTAPSSFFLSSIHLLSIIATQAHYALFPSFRKFFERVIFPLIKSRYSTLEQKIGLLSVVRAIFSQPALVVAYFINYDCLAPLDHDIGFLQFILHNVVEIAFLDYSSDASSPSIGTNVWVVFSSLQQASLRCECLSLVGMIVEAMWRWLEEPVEVNQIVLQDNVTSQYQTMNNSFNQQSSYVQQQLHQLQHYHKRSESRGSALFLPPAISNQNLQNNNNNNNSQQQTAISPSLSNVHKDNSIVGINNHYPSPPESPTVAVGLPPLQQQPQQQHLKVNNNIENNNNLSLLQLTPSATANNNLNNNNNNKKAQKHQRQLTSASFAGGNNSLSYFPNADHDDQEVPLYGEPDIPANVLYHWKHLHHALMNRLIELEAKMLFDQNWKQARQFLIQHKVISPASSETHFEEFAAWIHETPHLKKTSICAIFEKMIRDKNNEAIASAYIGLFDYRHVQIDEGLRKLLVSLMCDDSIPKFEGQVWEKLMALFAVKYHEQNHGDADESINLSQDDVDAMANAVFFLHSTEHNAAVKEKMTAQSFVRNAADMVQGKKLPESFWLEVFNRVCRRPWGPEVHSSQQIQEIDGSVEWKQNYWGQVPKKDAGSNLWAGNMASHSEYFGSLRYAEQLQLRYIQRAAECFSAFVSACGGNAAQVRRGTKQAAYCAPHYAIHVRLMMRMFYPVIAAACILGNKLCFTGPHVTLAQTLNHYVPPLLSIFGISTDEPSVKIAVAKVFQQLLEQEHTCTTALAGHPGVMLLSTTSFI